MSKSITTTSTVSKDNISGKISERSSISYTEVASSGNTFASVGRAGRILTSGNFLRSLLSIILILCLVFNLFLGIGGNTDRYFSFEKFLEVCAQFPSIPMSWISVLHFSESWGIFDVLRPIVNAFVSVLQVALFVSTSVINTMLGVGYFIGFIMVLPTP